MAHKIVLNGRPATVEDGVTLAQLLEARGVNPGRVAVELNRRIVPRGEFISTRLQPGDVLEVVNFVGGG